MRCNTLTTIRYIVVQCIAKSLNPVTLTSKFRRIRYVGKYIRTRAPVQYKDDFLPV